jgi:hypothetical protein
MSASSDGAVALNVEQARGEEARQLRTAADRRHLTYQTTTTMGITTMPSTTYPRMRMLRGIKFGVDRAHTQISSDFE